MDPGIQRTLGQPPGPKPGEGHCVAAVCTSGAARRMGHHGVSEPSPLRASPDGGPSDAALSQCHVSSDVGDGTNSSTDDDTRRLDLAETTRVSSYQPLWRQLGEPRVQLRLAALSPDATNEIVEFQTEWQVGGALRPHQPDADLGARRVPSLRLRGSAQSRRQWLDRVPLGSGRLCDHSIRDRHGKSDSSGHE
ncbi:Uncharacterised protein [Mycobacteroides abscessus subsp. abscessus]|nr:Uncharacterised protein [Mycobacteroides abscessus subsp. abscessus]